MKRIRNESSPVDLFPFTAVLLSAMGALVFLLFVMTTTNAAQAESSASRPERAHVDLPALRTLIIEHESFEQQSTEMEAKARRLEGDVSQDRERRLRPWVHVAELRQRIEDFIQLEIDADTHLTDQRLVLQRAVNHAGAQEAALTQRKRELEGQRGRVPVVWRGSSETTLRPVFFDCTADAVSQVGGRRFELGVDDPDFTTADNAFMAHMKALKNEDRYAVFIVRPSGIQFYNLAIFLCSRSKASYGYLAVEDNVVLEFPTEATEEDKDS